MKATDILAKAEGHMRDRAATYDKPEGERSMARAVAAFNAIHGTSLTVAQGWHFMAVLKQVRLFTRPGYDADSLEDLVAYCALLGEEMSSKPTLNEIVTMQGDDQTERLDAIAAIEAKEKAERPLQAGDEVYFVAHNEEKLGTVKEYVSESLVIVTSGDEEWRLHPRFDTIRLVTRPLLQEDAPYVDPYDQPARG